MTIKEINELRVQQEQIRQDDYKSHEELCKESQEAIKQLDELEQATHDKLVRKIGKHFKGIKPILEAKQNGVYIRVMGDMLLQYSVGKFIWNTQHITSKLAHTIKGEYEEVYGEPKEIKYHSGIDYICNDALDACDYQFSKYFPALNRK